MPACLGGCEVNRFLIIQKHCFGGVQLLLHSGLAPALDQTGAPGEEPLLSCGFSSGALGSIQLSDCMCWPKSHSLKYLLPL